MKEYIYVGSNELLDLVKKIPKGQVVFDGASVAKWINETDQELNADDEIIATFVVNTFGQLVIADRQSEHVVCAGGENVLSAGEITFHVGKNSVVVTEITNQSTGYCPDIVSWDAAEAALNLAGLKHPEGFTRKFVFRKCEKCGELNIVKEAWYVCVFCDTDLPGEWNIS
ncbi:hypothetical protein OLMES_1794 [Oleiphilus messinensis]|uniref:Uncharacterized protein n=1 Tax=Oleiphilus messinensis TaxID=141451 RepID=A0A1Y0I5U9_9GAMM|nr:hypothetical protein [Oleiphilus messinensis]ARU55868.1 hypothetical protein OLMES_1794 [Oleiphilus messinensis]